MINSTQFVRIRNHLGKSQVQIAQLLGISLRAVQSYEQGWRKVPSTIGRQMLFLLYKKIALKVEIAPCWQQKSCDLKTREKCPAWEFRAGQICWFINGTVCDGEVQENWNQKMRLCYQCEVFESLFRGFI